MKDESRKPTDTPDPHPEGFVGHHIKVITFAVCMVVFFALFGPISFFRIRDCAQQKQAEDLPELTADTIIDFVHDPSLLTIKRLRTYRGVWKEADKGNTFTAQFGHYILLAFEDPSTGKMTFCEVTDLNNDTRLDLMDRNANPEAFFGK